VLCFGIDGHEVRFRPIRSVIRHPLTEKLYEVRTAYGRSVRVTASHSVFVHEDGAIRLKFGAELKVGDRVVAPRRLRLPENAPARIALLRALRAVPAAARQLRVRGEAVANIACKEIPSPRLGEGAVSGGATTVARTRIAIGRDSIALADLSTFDL